MGRNGLALYYTISEDKLGEVMLVVRRHLDASVDEVTAFVCRNWPEGDEHYQHWLDESSPEEIADWVITEMEKMA